NRRVMAVGEGADEVADKRRRHCWTRWRNATPVDTSWRPNNTVWRKLELNILDQQPYSTHNPRYMVSCTVRRGGQDATRGENDVDNSRPGETCPGSQRSH